MKILNLKLVTLLEYQYVKILLQKTEEVFWSEEVFVITKVKILLRFMEKKLQKTNENEFSIEKVIKRKGDKWYVKWKGYDNSFNNWIDKWANINEV